MIPSLYENFQHWSKKGSVYIISDLHFGDSDCKLMDENWLSPDEHVDLINSIVKKNDTLIVLGDVGNTSYISKLKAGYKVLIMGNHDSGKSNYQRKVICEEFNTIILRKEVCQMLSNKYPDSKIKDVKYSINKHSYAFIDNNLFDEVYDGALFISSKIILSHEPIHGLNFCMNIHGHDHNPENKGDSNHLNLASNVCKYKPVNLGELIKNGFFSNIKDIHRITIDNAIENPIKKDN